MYLGSYLMLVNLIHWLYEISQAIKSKSQVLYIVSSVATLILKTLMQLIFFTITENTCMYYLSSVCFLNDKIVIKYNGNNFLLKKLSINVILRLLCLK